MTAPTYTQITITKKQSPRFRGELMVCSICGAEETSSDQRLSQWTWLTTTDLQPWGHYYCPDEPTILYMTHFLKSAESERQNRTERYQK